MPPAMPTSAARRRYRPARRSTSRSSSQAPSRSSRRHRADDPGDDRRTARHEERGEHRDDEQVDEALARGGCGRAVEEQPLREGGEPRLHAVAEVERPLEAVGQRSRGRRGRRANGAPTGSPTRRSPRGRRARGRRRRRRRRSRRRRSAASRPSGASTGVSQPSSGAFSHATMPAKTTIPMMSSSGVAAAGERDRRADEHRGPEHGHQERPLRCGRGASAPASVVRGPGSGGGRGVGHRSLGDRQRPCARAVDGATGARGGSP